MKTLKKIALLLSVFLCFLTCGCACGQTAMKPLDESENPTLTTEEGEIDYEFLTNYLTRVTMKGLVRIESQVGIGSGVIYAFHEDEYYVLTNNHVVYDARLSGYGFTIRDCYGKEYEGEFLCGESAYDLAILKFDKGRDELNKISFAEENPKIGQKVLSLGVPYGQANAVTYGHITKYKVGYIPNYAASSVRFDCIEHDAWMATGSSGGMLLDTACRLVGVNFAVVPHVITGEFKRGMSIPVEKVNEFLLAKGYHF